MKTKKVHLHTFHRDKNFCLCSVIMYFLVLILHAVVCMITFPCTLSMVPVASLTDIV